MGPLLQSSIYKILLYATAVQLNVPRGPHHTPTSNSGSYPVEGSNYHKKTQKKLISLFIYTLCVNDFRCNEL